MIDTIREHEILEIKKIWKEGFPQDDGRQIEAYFSSLLKCEETYVYRENSEIICMAQVRPKVLVLNEKRLRVHYITKMMTRPQYQGQGYMRKFLDGLLDMFNEKSIITLLKGYESQIFESFGFEKVIDVASYNIAGDDLPDFSVSGILLKPKFKDLVTVYQDFTQHFNGHFERSEADFEQLSTYWSKLNGHIVGFMNKDKLVAYCAFIKHENYVEVLEYAYDKSGSLIRILSFISKGMKHVLLRTSNTENMHRIFPNSIKRESPFMMARINDKELFERLFDVRIISAYSAFKAFDKPLFNRDYQ